MPSKDRCCHTRIRIDTGLFQNADGKATSIVGPANVLVVSVFQEAEIAGNGFDNVIVHVDMCGQFEA